MTLSVSTICGERLRGAVRGGGRPGLVAEQARGTSRIYHLREEGLQAVQEYLERVWGDAARRFRLMAENTE